MADDKTGSSFAATQQEPLVRCASLLQQLNLLFKSSGQVSKRLDREAKRHSPKSSRCVRSQVQMTQACIPTSDWPLQKMPTNIFRQSHACRWCLFCNGTRRYAGTAAGQRIQLRSCPDMFHMHRQLDGGCTEFAPTRARLNQCSAFYNAGTGALLR